MIRELMALVHDALQRLRIVHGAVARDEERRFHAARGQLVEQTSRVGPGAVVKRDGEQLCTAIQIFCAADRGETAEKHKKKQ